MQSSRPDRDAITPCRLFISIEPTTSAILRDFLSFLDFAI